ncbi:AtpZ/AtpI family protein [Pseudahrensia aquimaris]|uniref:ATP synthase protein I n=1 Tax=Pseudahrensia aquimaris TaxID=744461 RepID=A0ABW3FFF3_9HYPH
MSNDLKSDGDLDARLKRLEERIGRSKSERAQTENEAPQADKAQMAQAFRLSSEFIAAIVVGALIGYGIDAFFGVSPFGLLIFLLLGFAAGIVNVLRAVGKVAESPLRGHKDAEDDAG